MGEGVGGGGRGVLEIGERDEKQNGATNLIKFSLGCGEGQGVVQGKARQGRAGVKRGRVV